MAGPSTSTCAEWCTEDDLCSPCNEWPGSRTAAGYGCLRRDGRTVYAHRVAYEEVHGPIPEGLQIDHLCRNRACVNPEHLEAVTQQENIRRGRGHGSETHCRHGHPYDEENTYRRPDGTGRDCLTCRRERDARRTGRRRGRA